jgi:hypothetical protein
MKSLVTLLATLIDELGGYCTVDTSMDLKTIHRRFDNEGSRFLTVTLPNLGKGLERALALGRTSPDLYPGFRSRQNSPIFLGGFFDLVFDRTSGSVLDYPSIESIRSLRQISLFFKKMELECSPEVIQAAFDAYVQSDKEVGEWEQGVPIELLIEFHQMSSLLFSDVFLSVDREISGWTLSPRHGPGATADSLVGNYKYLLPEYTERLESVAPYWRYATTRGYSSMRYDRTLFLSPGNERPVKVVHVPKTLEAPRVIAEEPSYMQYVQQGIFRSIRKFAENSFLDEFIGTKYQEPNQLLARQGSIDGSLATLDLSEASDRVSNLLVQTMTANFPHLYDAVQACRSTRADVPGRGTIVLHRFASMGSALCFPMESMVFMTVVFLGIQKAYRRRFTRISDIRDFSGLVRIYGDDIIVPVDTVDSVRSMLRLFGFKINVNKSFWTGMFRESCGKEYYAGEDVTICRVRRPLPSSRSDVDDLVSAVSLRNQAYERGLWKTAGWLDTLIESVIPFPVVAETSSILGRISCLGLPEYKIDSKLHRPLVKGAVVRYRRRFSPIDDDPALMKCIGTYVEDDPDTGRPIAQPARDWVEPLVSDVDHLTYAGRPVAQAIQYRMAYAD